jgi:hypothetical protein
MEKLTLPALTGSAAGSRPGRQKTLETDEQKDALAGTKTAKEEKRGVRPRAHQS